MAQTDPVPTALELGSARESRLDEQAEAELAAGLGVPHERVRAWLAKLASGEREPPPSE